jgi:hypothetical protein
VQLTGDYTLEGFKRVIDEILVETARRGCPKVLLDTSTLAIGNLSTFDRFEMGRYAAGVWGYRVKAAVIALPEVLTRFAETVAVNRGAMVAVFARDDEALAWLRSSAVRSQPTA